MRKVLFVIPSLEYSGAAKQLLLLAAGLPRPEVLPRVCVLGHPGPWADLLASHGVAVEALGWQHVLDVRPLVRLRQLVRSFQPDVIHAWHLPALRAVAAAVGLGASRIVASAPLVPRRRGPSLGWLDRWLLGRVACLTASGAAEAERFQRVGLPADRVLRIAPGVAPAEPETTRAAVCQALGLPTSVRLVAGVGPLEPHKGFRDAIWALDILRFLYDDLHLVLVGRGGEQSRLEQFARVAGLADRVHFLGPQTSPLALLAEADVVWVPSHAEGGVNTALEAMGLGRPVVASRLPGLAEVIVDGETGCLIEPGDKAALARQTRLLLDDPARRRRLGEAGHQRVARHFSVQTLVRHYTQLYGRAG